MKQRIVVLWLYDQSDQTNQQGHVPSQRVAKWEIQIGIKEHCEVEGEHLEASSKGVEHEEHEAQKTPSHLRQC